MRYMILIALLLCLPVRGEAWQVVGGGAATTSGGPFLVDTFTEASTNTLLSAHAPEIGGTWASNGDATATIDYTTGKLYTPTNGAVLYGLNSVTPTSDDYTVTVSVARTGTATHGAGAFARASYDGNGIDGYCARYVRGASQSFALVRFDNGALTTLSSFDLTANSAEIATGSYRRITLTVAGSTITGKLFGADGVSIVSELTATDTTYPDAGSAGVYIYDDSIRIDSIEAE